MLRGFGYLVAVMDWYSRYVLAWELSITTEKEFCISALDRALKILIPRIFNTDQVSQFTSTGFKSCLEGNGIAISMDGRGRVFDNIFIVWLWRTVKYEQVYLNDYQDVAEARRRLSTYFEFYKTERTHSSLGGLTPLEVYFKEHGHIDPTMDLSEHAPNTHKNFV